MMNSKLRFVSILECLRNTSCFYFWSHFFSSLVCLSQHWRPLTLFQYWALWLNDLPKLVGSNVRFKEFKSFDTKRKKETCLCKNGFVTPSESVGELTSLWKCDQNHVSQWMSILDINLDIRLWDSYVNAYIFGISCNKKRWNDYEINSINFISSDARIVCTPHA